MKITKRNIKIAAFSVPVLLMAGGGIFFHHSNNSGKSLQKIGVVSDIHAANDEMRQTDMGEAYNYPRKYKEHFRSALRDMKRQGIGIVVALGDNTNVGSKKYSETLLKIASEEKMTILWAKGNHDRRTTDAMKHLGVDQYYYTTDFGDWRIVVLDSSEINGNGPGGLSSEQIAWLEEQLKTDRNVIIAMHHPIWEREAKESVYPFYEEFQGLLAKHPNVKHVLAGHYHVDDWQRKERGIDYRIIPSLTLEPERPRYEILDLESNT